ncbi:MAG: hypothetical protein EOM62_05235 [Bacteroidia bacterium]|nr:hypothetical protein [Bacteroidia bacterium]
METVVAIELGWGHRLFQLHQVVHLDHLPVVIFDVDVLGGLNIKKQFGDRALAIFIKPPTIDCLKKRLASRGTENADSLKQRMEKAEYELSFEKFFDKIVVNENLTDAQQEVVHLMKEFLSTPLT